jgi:ubiquinone biosynthesis protein
MEREILYALRDTYDPATGRAQTGRAMLRLLHIFGANGIEIAQDYALVAKAVFTIEEAGTALDPEFNLRACFQPAVDALIRERRDPRQIWRRLRQSFTSGLGRLQELPGELQRVLRLLEEGGTTINFKHQGLDRLDDTINDASNKITVAVIIASLIIGSSLVVRANVPPLILDRYSVLGIAGYLLSAILGMWVVVDILRRGRRR